jgi:hypothetical protein
MIKMGGSAPNENCLSGLSVLDGRGAAGLQLPHRLHHIFHADAHVAVSSHDLADLQ